MQGTSWLLAVDKLLSPKVFLFFSEMNSTLAKGGLMIIPKQVTWLWIHRSDLTFGWILWSMHENLTTLLKKIKGSDVLDVDREIIFQEQDNTDYFLFISSFSLYSIKFQNRQNNLFFTKDV